MSLTQNIVATYRGPRTVFRRLLSGPRNEVRVLVFALLAGLLLFVAGAPYQARMAQLDPTSPIEARLYWTGFFWILIVPLLLYIGAALWWALLRLIAPQVGGYQLRMAIFWSLLAASPAFLLAGMVAGFIGSGLQLQLVVLLSLMVFLWFLVSGLRAVIEVQGD